MTKKPEVASHTFELPKAVTTTLIACPRENLTQHTFAACSGLGPALGEFKAIATVLVYPERPTEMKIVLESRAGWTPELVSDVQKAIDGCFSAE